MFKFDQLQTIHLEISNNCQASCPMCSRNINGGQDNPLIKISDWTLDEFKEIMNPKVLNQITTFYFCGTFGDPMMNKDVIEMCRYAKETNPNLYVHFHTNGGARKEDWWKELATVLPENHRVIFAIDGLEDTNHIYRRNVNWTNLMNNVQAYISAGGKAQWDYLVFAHNEHQLEEAKTLAGKLKFLRFNPAKPHGFRHNGKIRIVNRTGKFIGTISQSENFKVNLPPIRGDDITYDISEQYCRDYFALIRDKVYNKNIEIFNKFSESDHLKIKNCTSVVHKEIYLDAQGGIHPCCWMGHISQDDLELSELVYHKKWIDDTIGLENINALNKPIKDIMESYFHLIEESWSKTFATGRNPYCAFKCGLERPAGMTRH